MQILPSIDHQSTIVCSKPPEPKAAAPADDGGKEDTRMKKLRSDKVAQRGRGRPESPTSATVDSGTRFGCNSSRIMVIQCQFRSFGERKNLRVDLLENRWAAKLKILYRKKSFPPPSTLDRIRFSSLNHKTGYLDSSNFRNRSRDLL